MEMTERTLPVRTKAAAERDDISEGDPRQALPTLIPEYP